MADEGEKRPIEGNAIGILLDRSGCEMRFWYEAFTDTPPTGDTDGATGDLNCVSSPALGGVGSWDAATSNPLLETAASELLSDMLASCKTGSLVTVAILLRNELFEVI